MLSTWFTGNAWVNHLPLTYGWTQKDRKKVHHKFQGKLVINLLVFIRFGYGQEEQKYNPISHMMYEEYFEKKMLQTYHLDDIQNVL